MTSPPAPVFETRQLQVNKGGSLILDIDRLTVSQGETLGLIGPNGAGKSTLLQTLSALIKPSRGEIFFRGRRIGADIPILDYRRKLAMVLQEPLLFDTTVYHNVASGLKLRGLKRRQLDPIVADTLERFAIAELRNRSARTLSGGEARKVSIARAFATQPEVLLLDEPFSALDPLIRETLIEDLEKVLRESRLTTILVTHDRAEALRLATRLGVMYGGRILQIGSIAEVTQRPATEFVASLVGIENILRATVVPNVNETAAAAVAGRIVCFAGQARAGDEVSLCIRPERVRLLAEAPAEAARGLNIYPATVSRITPIGFYHKVRLDCGFPLITHVSDHTASRLSLRVGSAVQAAFAVVDTHAIRH